MDSMHDASTSTLGDWSLGHVRRRHLQEWHVRLYQNIFTCEHRGIDLIHVYLDEVSRQSIRTTDMSHSGGTVGVSGLPTVTEVGLAICYCLSTIPY